MGPVSGYNMIIAPAFYGAQVDISGPLKVNSPHNKRAAIKIWHVVFCCMTTSTTSIKVMEDYSTIAFVQAFAQYASKLDNPNLWQQIKEVNWWKAVNQWGLHSKISGRNYINITRDTDPVGDNYNGKTERRIWHITESLDKR